MATLNHSSQFFISAQGMSLSSTSSSHSYSSGLSDNRNPTASAFLLAYERRMQPRLLESAEGKAQTKKRHRELSEEENNGDSQPDRYGPSPPCLPSSSQNSVSAPPQQRNRTSSLSSRVALLNASLSIRTQPQNVSPSPLLENGATMASVSPSNSISLEHKTASMQQDQPLESETSSSPLSFDFSQQSKDPWNPLALGTLTSAEFDMKHDPQYAMYRNWFMRIYGKPSCGWIFLQNLLGICKSKSFAIGMELPSVEQSLGNEPRLFNFSIATTKCRYKQQRRQVPSAYPFVFLFGGGGTNFPSESETPVSQQECEILLKDLEFFWVIDGVRVRSMNGIPSVVLSSRFVYFCIWGFLGNCQDSLFGEEIPCIVPDNLSGCPFSPEMLLSDCSKFDYPSYLEKCFNEFRNAIFQLDQCYESNSPASQSLQPPILPPEEFTAFWKRFYFLITLDPVSLEILQNRIKDAPEVPPHRSNDSTFQPWTSEDSSSWSRPETAAIFTAVFEDRWVENYFGAPWRAIRFLHCLLEINPDFLLKIGLRSKKNTCESLQNCPLYIRNFASVVKSPADVPFLFAFDDPQCSQATSASKCERLFNNTEFFWAVSAANDGKDFVEHKLQNHIPDVLSSSQFIFSCIWGILGNRCPGNPLIPIVPDSVVIEFSPSLSDERRVYWHSLFSRHCNLHFDKFLEILNGVGYSNGWNPFEKVEDASMTSFAFPVRCKICSSLGKVGGYPNWRDTYSFQSGWLCPDCNLKERSKIKRRKGAHKLRPPPWSSERCWICLERLKNDILIFAPCRHYVFHPYCALQWMFLQNQSSCVCCRKEIESFHWLGSDGEEEIVQNMINRRNWQEFRNAWKVMKAARYAVTQFADVFAISPAVLKVNSRVLTQSAILDGDEGEVEYLGRHCDSKCMICNTEKPLLEEEKSLMFCENDVGSCVKVAHYQCCNLPSVPEGKWYCSYGCRTSSEEGS